MRLNCKKLSLIFALAFCGNNLFAQNVEVKNILNPTVYEELEKTGSIIQTRDNGSKTLTLLPNVPGQEKIKQNLVQKKDGNYPFTYEALYLINKKDVLQANKSSAKDIDIEYVSKIGRSFSKMQGMKYYSTTRKKELVLYEKAYTILNADSKDPIPDQLEGNANGKTLYVLQDDNSFGITRYEVTYNQSESELLLRFANKDDMGIGPFKAIMTDKMVINLLVTDCGDEILFYVCADLDSVKFPGIKAQITDSITSRMDAIYKWFLKQF